jgi:MFS family permease
MTSSSCHDCVVLGLYSDSSPLSYVAGSTVLVPERASVPDYSGEGGESEYTHPASGLPDYGSQSTAATRIEVDPYDVLAAALVPGALQRNDFRPEKKRWYVLLVFAWLSAMQGLVWCAFSTVPESTNNYFGEAPHSQNFVDLILNWGPIIYLPAVFIAGWMLTKQDGLRKAVLLGAALVFLGAGIRAIPTFFDDHTTSQWYVLLSIHFGSVLNALVGPLVLASPSYLSGNWFADGERATATAIGAISNGLGVGLAYLLGPAIVHSGEDISTFLRSLAVMAFIPLLLVVLYFPDHPERAPSATYADRAKKRHAGAEVSYWRGIGLAFTNRSFLFLCIAGGMQAGAWFVWSTTLPTILLPLAFSPSQAGSFASATRFAGMGGGFLAGRIADGTILQRRLKPMICLCMFMAIMCFSAFTLSNPSPAFYSDPPFPHSYGFEFVCVAAAGFFLGAVGPLFYELSAELTYPSPESTSGAIMTLVNNLVMLILYTSTPQFDVSNINTLMTCAISISMLILLTLTVSMQVITSTGNVSTRSVLTARLAFLSLVCCVGGIQASGCRRDAQAPQCGCGRSAAVLLASGGRRRAADGTMMGRPALCSPRALALCSVFGHCHLMRLSL